MGRTRRPVMTCFHQLLLVPFVLLALSCHTDDVAEIDSAPVPPPVMPEVNGDALGLLYWQRPAEGDPFSLVLTCGQLTEKQMGTLAEKGIEHFVSLQSSQRRGAGWEEAYASGNDLHFQRLAIDGAKDITLERSRELATLLDGLDRPAVLYSATSNSVGALLGLIAFDRHELTESEALKLARRRGMSDSYEPRLEAAFGSAGQ